MNAQQILHVAFSFLPFVVCLFWAISLAVKLRKANEAKRYFMAYITTCVVLYLSHGLFFTVGISSSPSLMARNSLRSPKSQVLPAKPPSTVTSRSLPPSHLQTGNVTPTSLLMGG